MKPNIMSSAAQIKGYSETKAGLATPENLYSDQTELDQGREVSKRSREEERIT